MGNETTAAGRAMAELNEFAYKDYDPEDNVVENTEDQSGSGDSDDDRLGTEHYVEVGKSKIRKRDEVRLGPQYAGASISREALEDSADEILDSDYESTGESQDDGGFADPDASDMDEDDEDGEIDSDEAFGESDAEKFKNFNFRGSGVSSSNKNGLMKTRKSATALMDVSNDEGGDLVSNCDMSFGHNEDVHSTDGTDEDGDSEEESQHNSVGSSDDEASSDAVNGEGSSDSDDDVVNEENSKRAELRRIMNEEQNTVVATISQTMKADAEKGKAVKQQRKTFDSLLNVRIRLQKALVATNSMSAAEDKESADMLPYQAAEAAAIKLLNTLGGLREALNKVNGSTPSGKRKRTIDLDTSSSDIWKQIQSAESTAISTRQSILEKWSSRVRDTNAQTVTRNFNTSAPQSIIDVLNDQLSNSDRLVKRTKMPRSCAPIQVKRKVNEDPNIYDDADFYQLLLKELVDQRMADPTPTTAALGDRSRLTAQLLAVKEAKTKKNVDTRASKGRKMRYTVHEKLQNFMAPEERGTWEPDAVDRFFGTLLGQNMTLREEVEEGDANEAGEEMPLAEEALILFRS